jgi:predicted NBD/HSP70 family sugar kinase
VDSPDWDESETPCPPELRQKAEAVGVLQELSDALGVPLLSVVDAADEFVGYWTIGEGMGKRRRHWMRKLREHVRRAHRERRLRPPGEVEAAALKVADRKAADEALLAEARAGKFGAKVQRDVEAGKLGAAVLRALLEERQQERAGAA